VAKTPRLLLCSRNPNLLWLYSSSLSRFTIELNTMNIFEVLILSLFFLFPVATFIMGVLL
jgi:hypothetical protein